MPKGVDEHLWSEAKKAVKKQYPKISEGSDRFYRLVMGIYKKMQGDGTTTAKKAGTAKSSELSCPGSKIRSGGQGQGLGRGGGKGPLGVPLGAKSIVLMAKGDRILAKVIG